MIRKTGKATEGRKTELARGGHKKDELVNKQKNRGMRTAHWSGVIGTLVVRLISALVT